MSIAFWPVLPIAAVGGRFLLSRYLRHARHRRFLARLEDALWYDVPRPWHRDVRQALRSADDWVAVESHDSRKKRASSEARPDNFVFHQTLVAFALPKPGEKEIDIVTPYPKREPQPGDDMGLAQ